MVRCLISLWLRLICCGSVSTASSVCSFWCRRAISMRHFEAFHGETIADFYESSRMTLPKREITAFSQPLECDKPHSVLLIGQIGPDDVIEDVLLDGVDGEREG